MDCTKLKYNTMQVIKLINEPGEYWDEETGRFINILVAENWFALPKDSKIKVITIKEHSKIKEEIKIKEITDLIPTLKLSKDENVLINLPSLPVDNRSL